MSDTCSSCNICTTHNFQKQKLNLKLKEALQNVGYSVLFKGTHNCNIKCTYCYDRIAQVKHGKGVMTIERAKKIIDMIEADPRPCVCFTFHGGEPLMAGYEWFEKLLPYIKEKMPKLTLSLQSNCTLLNEKYIDLFKKYDLTVGLSYDVYPDDLPKELKYRPNIPLKRLQKLVDYDRETEPRVLNGFISVISGVNYKDLPNSLLKGKETGLNPAFNFLFPTNEISLGQDMFFSYEEYAEELKKFLLFYLTEIDDPDPERSLTHLTSILHGGTYSCCNRKNCSYGWVGIGPNGELAHCDTYTYGKYALGNIDDYEHITDMQYTEAYNNIACDKKNKRLTNCQRCKLSDICRGTCFANSLNDEGDGMIFDSNACNELHYGLFGLYQIYRNYNVFDCVKKNQNNLFQKQLILNDFYTMWEINKVIKKELGVDLYTIDKHALDSPHSLFQSKEYQIFRIFNPSEAIDDVLSDKPKTKRISLYNADRIFGEYIPQTERTKELLQNVINFNNIQDERRIAIKYGLVQNLEEIKKILNI